jgi:hypothetical protein
MSSEDICLGCEQKRSSHPVIIARNVGGYEISREYDFMSVMIHGDQSYIRDPDFTIQICEKFVDSIQLQLPVF